MYRYRKYINLCLFIIIVALSYNSINNPIEINEEVTTTLSHAIKKEDSLYMEIEEKSKEFEQPPVDAYIDDVWKKTPGRNGIKVNIDKSYEKMKDKGVFDESLLVYKEIPPKVKLADLQASPIYRGHPEKEMVSFLINVSWGTEYIPDILKTLNDHKVKATFFIEGKWAKENPELVKMIDEQGHIIGNHAYNHPDMATLSNQKIVEQITQTNEILTAITDKTPKWFAPPSGSFNDQVVQSAFNLKMETILWTVDTIDWKNPSVNVMINRVNSKIHPGATILMHPTSVIANGLDDLIKVIKEKEYRIGTIEKLLSEER
ncbi:MULTISPECIES: polysaccharide deacetylase family protein [Oceanobacillus]|uniref:polysaccharide deacetylase family protein n=1 Tax=Oceanobacillus TaxID=182709 RepID=UPI001957A402|nr:polysaccharide deacetylase family protein [Oceanobacillus caeni]MED4474613.1 polysaccharide deacetylase family protein [Oceanobacillus caeni]